MLACPRWWPLLDHNTGMWRPLVIAVVVLFPNFGRADVGCAMGSGCAAPAGTPRRRKCWRRSYNEIRARSPRGCSSGCVYRATGRRDARARRVEPLLRRLRGGRDRQEEGARPPVRGAGGALPRRLAGRQRHLPRRRRRRPEGQGRRARQHRVGGAVPREVRRRARRAVAARGAQGAAQGRRGARALCAGEDGAERPAGAEREVKRGAGGRSEERRRARRARRAAGVDDEAGRDALATARQALAINPEDVRRAHRRRRRRLSARRHARATRRSATTCSQTNPRAWEFFHGIAEFLVKEHRYVEANALEEEALKLEPKSWVALAAHRQQLAAARRRSEGPRGAAAGVEARSVQRAHVQPAATCSRT